MMKLFTDHLLWFQLLLASLVSCSAGNPKSVLLELHLKEQDIGGFDRRLDIEYTVIDPNRPEAGYRFRLEAASYGWVLKKEMEIASSQVERLTPMLLEAGLADLPPLRIDRADMGVRREMNVVMRLDGEKREFKLRSYGLGDRYAFDAEPGDWRSWIARLRSGDLAGDRIPTWVYDRIFHMVLNEAFSMLPDKSMEAFCRQGAN